VPKSYIYSNLLVFFHPLLSRSPRTANGHVASVFFGFMSNMFIVEYILLYPCSCARDCDKQTLVVKEFQIQRTFMHSVDIV
jgi:hypothetical protein